VTTRVLTLCAGNAVRSVLCAALIDALAPAQFATRSAGTHAAEGQGVSARTVAAAQWDDLDLASSLRTHRSHQVTADDVAWSDIVLCAEADHVAFCRARFGDGGQRAVQLGLFCRATPLGAPLADQVRAVADLPYDDALDVSDPAGREQDAYDACAAVLRDLVEVFLTVAGDG
jgi:protein-tyrosine-phosphatase